MFFRRGEKMERETSSIFIRKLVLEAFSSGQYQVSSIQRTLGDEKETRNSGTIWHRVWPGFVRLSIILVADGKPYRERKTKREVELALFFPFLLPSLFFFSIFPSLLLFFFLSFFLLLFFPLPPFPFATCPNGSRTNKSV